METKHYEKAVEIIVGRARTGDEQELLVGAFIALFSGDNPRFDERRFREAVLSEQSPSLRS